MSGPKVVRLVTIEEVREICRGHLARLDATLARWEKICRRNDAMTDEDVLIMRSRRAEIALLMTKERYLDLQKQVPLEMQWIETDLVKRLAAATLRVADASTRARRREMLAAQLLQRATLTAEQRRDLEAIAQGNDINGVNAETVLGEALRRTASTGGRDDDDTELQALAQRLSVGQKGETLDDWLAANPSEDESGSSGDSIDSAIAGLAVAGAVKDAERLAARYRAILTEPASNARKMRTDTLLLEVSRTLERRRQAVRQLAELEITLAEARAVLDPAHASLIADAETALLHDDAATAAAVRERLSEAIASQCQSFAAASRRRAVLAALAEVGYEAREGMETGEPAGGRLVARRATNPDMGVEIAGGSASARLQLRPVRFASAGSTGDSSKDRDIETIWCSDFQRLLDRLGTLDADLVVERVTPVGEVPVMVVQELQGESERRSSIPSSRQFSS